MTISLQNTQSKHWVNSAFQHATDGAIADFGTEVALSYDVDYLKVDFFCKDNLFTHQNTMKLHNEPLYNQEVFEVFIGLGKADTPVYFEIEINPNNAVWIGEISNPLLGESVQSTVRQFSPDVVGILHGVAIEANTWSGYLHIPWSFIGVDPMGNYRINFYRIRSRVSHSDPDWECNSDSCDFVCWNSTLSGESPAFHRPKRFGYLEVAFTS